MKELSLLILTLIIHNYAVSQVIITDRPSQSNGSYVIPKGSFQVESAVGIEIIGSNNGGFYERNFILPTSLFRLGLSDRFELRMQNQFSLSQINTSFITTLTQSIIDDLQVGFKWKFTDGSDFRTQLALVSHAVLPTGNFTNNNFGVINTLVFSKRFNTALSYAGNIGHAYSGSGKGDLNYSLILSYGVTEKLTVFIESFGSYFNFDDATINADAGFAVVLTDRTQLDYSFGIGLNNRYNFHQLGFSILFRK